MKRIPESDTFMARTARAFAGETAQVMGGSLKCDAALVTEGHPYSVHRKRVKGNAFCVVLF